MRKTITVIGYYIVTFSDGSWFGEDKHLSDTETVDDIKRSAEEQFNKQVTSVEYHACEPITYSYEGV